ncbi:MAG: hypothetical protein AAFR82_12415, partial [Pseudomonadota bacterium]
ISNRFQAAALKQFETSSGFFDITLKRRTFKFHLIGPPRRLLASSRYLKGVEKCLLSNLN